MPSHLLRLVFHYAVPVCTLAGHFVDKEHISDVMSHVSDEAQSSAIHRSRVSSVSSSSMTVNAAGIFRHLPAEDISVVQLGNTIVCEWSDWGAWSPCTYNCSSHEAGRMERTRMKVDSITKSANQNCSESETKEELCSVDCTNNCVWSLWTPFSTCSKTCGGGRTRRTRTHFKEASSGGQACVGRDHEEYACNTELCPITCVWTTWNPWSTCSTTCGSGLQTRDRNVVSQDWYGGAPCRGDSTESQSCHIVECPIDCEYGDWTAWSSCSTDCGSGINQRWRNKTVVEQYGGVCAGGNYESKSCNTHCCVVNCQWGSWENWQGCSEACGGGQRSRMRAIAVAASCNGIDCTGNFTEDQECNTAPCPIDCEWNDWLDWSYCPVTCGPGQRTRLRSIKQVALHNGKPCSGSNSETGPCASVERCIHPTPAPTPHVPNPDTTTTTTTTAGPEYELATGVLCPEDYMPLTDIDECKGGLSVGGTSYSWNDAADFQSGTCADADWPGTGCFESASKLFFSTCTGRDLARPHHTVICKKVKFVFADSGSCPAGYSPLEDKDICAEGFDVYGVHYSWNQAQASQVEHCAHNEWPREGCFKFGTQLFYSNCDISGPLTVAGHTIACMEGMASAPQGLSTHATPAPTPPESTFLVGGYQFEVTYATGDASSFCADSKVLAACKDMVVSITEVSASAVAVSLTPMASGSLAQVGIIRHERRSSTFKVDLQFALNVSMVMENDDATNVNVVTSTLKQMLHNEFINHELTSVLNAAMASESVNPISDIEVIGETPMETNKSDDSNGPLTNPSRTITYQNYTGCEVVGGCDTSTPTAVAAVSSHGGSSGPASNSMDALSNDAPPSNSDSSTKSGASPPESFAVWHMLLTALSIRILDRIALPR